MDAFSVVGGLVGWFLISIQSFAFNSNSNKALAN